MTEPRVAITGIGVVSAFGVGRELFWDRISRGISGVRAITDFEPQGPCRVAAAVPEEALLDEAPGETSPDGSGAGRADPRRYAKVSRIAVLAAREAFRDARLVPEEEVDAGVLVGSGAGGIDVAERQYGEFFSGELHRVSPYAIPVSIVGIVASEISIALGLRGSATCFPPAARARRTRSATPRR
jgi:3-oxoacyl-[acyl-carrier-protein] synthase II